MIVLTSRTLSAPWQAALAAALFLALPAHSYNVSIRPDYPCLLLMLLSLHYSLRAEPDRALTYVIPGVLGGFASLIKQSGVAVLLAIGIVLLTKKRYTHSAVLVIAAGAPIVLALGFLFWRHEPFWPQLTVIGKDMWSSLEGIHWTLRMFRSPAMLIPVILFFLGLPCATTDGRCCSLRFH